ncbi:hypothetical protein BV25DRAFT_1792048 [Artomyces pyxidatus]|uniref:Uncharacterized protein n=1 Tax=Artomyces pyxidatus TaxID=48021 RepID=A0ACB8TJH8_9AGAM|nr:hypothetical protein BV25DRAFT_1792048 [Artomyces pyxidatus]
MDVDSGDDTWRDGVRVCMQTLTLPEMNVWMQENSDLNAEEFAVRALEYIETHFPRILTDTATEHRLSIGKALKELPCLLFHPGSTTCTRLKGPNVFLAKTYMTVVMRLLEGEESEVAPAVHKIGYDALGCALRHQSNDCGTKGLDPISDFLRRSMSHSDRGVRLSAGRALVEIIRLYNSIGPTAYTSVEPIFDTFYHLLEGKKDSVKETVLITVGQVGRATDADILGVAISCLVKQLANPNPLFKGIAFVQLTSLVKHFKKPPYSLIYPYMGQISPFLVSKWSSQPALLLEFCRFLSVVPADFIEATLQHTLPQLYGACELVVLDQISEDLGTKASYLFLKHANYILPHLFMLQGPGQTNQALTFVLKLLNESTDGGVIDVQAVVRSQTVQLLGTLVNTLGDVDEGKVLAATQALHKVEAILSIPPKGRQRQPSEVLPSFLKSHMLGIISHMIDLLHDVQGKKSAASKQQTLRGLGAMTSIIGPAISGVAPQIMATFQIMVGHADLAETALDSWLIFTKTLIPSEIGPHAGPTSASILANWPTLSYRGREVAHEILRYLVLDIGKTLDTHLDEIVDLGSVPALAEVHAMLCTLRAHWKEGDKLRKILDRALNDSTVVAFQALRELKTLLAEQRSFFHDLASGDIFSPIIGRILVALFSAAARDGDGTEEMRILAFECIGSLGAVDPDRFDFNMGDPRMIVLKNFTDDEESTTFALHLISDVLVSAFRSTSDIRHQTNLSYAMQELLKFCGFGPGLVSHTTTSSIPLRVRNRWARLPKHVLELATPLLEGKYTTKEKELPEIEHPVYPRMSTYREWIQLWTSHLIDLVPGPSAKAIFKVFGAAVRNKDVTVAHNIVPHLVLTVLVSGNEEDADNIRAELLAVLQDQVDLENGTPSDKKLLSAQAVFMLMDHLNKWVRLVRQEIGNKKTEGRRVRGNPIEGSLEEQLLRVDSILSSIDQDLMAKAAFQCKAYARSLMSYERQIVSLRERKAKTVEIQHCYERLHEIYANIDEPDGMEGVSTLILSPTLEHQIRQHESTGRWTSAQSCWELRLQQSPNNLEYHIGLLRCLRNLGHYDTLRTHVMGVLTRNPTWKSALSSFQVESAWMIGDWNDVQSLVGESNAQTPSMVIARLLIAIRDDDATAIKSSLSQARLVLGNPISASGAREYRHSYDAVLDLHIVHEVEMIHDFATSLPLTGPNSSRQRLEILATLSRNLSARLELTLPSFRIREPVLSMRRTAFGLSSNRFLPLSGEIGRSWLASAKIARKAGHWQTAYSAMLQAQQSRTAFSFVQSAKLIKATGEPLRALQELENSIHVTKLQEDNSDVIDLTGEDDETKEMKAKAEVLRSRWMNESDRFEMSDVQKSFLRAAEIWPKWESGWFYYGKFQDDCYKNLSDSDKRSRGTRMHLQTVRCFTKAIKYGSKFVYQTVPRLLTIWLDMGQDSGLAQTETFAKINSEVSRAIKGVPAYKWYTAFPQIASRVGHKNAEVYAVLSKLITMVIQEYPQQSLWLFVSVVKSTKKIRESRGRAILDQLKVWTSSSKNDCARLINECSAMVNELLALCDYPIKDESKRTLHMKKDFPGLARLTPSSLIIPLQGSLTAMLPPTSSASDSHHQPFPHDLPTFAKFLDEIDVMRSLARPRKLTIIGSDRETYMFLGKPKDDLRKDARLMDFNAIINKLLKANSDSRRRQLHIITYGVVTLNEECGFIQWVPNTLPIRPVLLKSYDARGIKSWSGEMTATFAKIKEATDKDAGKMFVDEILPLFPPVFHEWFLETFPEPSAWLASRLAYSRTSAVMCMVGFILGLGDRHCENILLDENTGAAVHVDFNCLFDKGKTLETPERVPFRLTQNMIDGMGVTGVEGVFRIACENTMQLLRDNKDMLMTVLDAFVHDPLVEWEDEKRKLEREAARRANKSTVNLENLAKNALNPIGKKLKGIYSTSRERPEKEISTSNLVQMLIQEATNDANLGKMYPGWAPWH